MTRFLVTGASGLLGLSLGLQVSERHAVTGVVNRNLLSGAPFPTLAVDFSRPGSGARLLEEVRPEVVIHCAAMANVDACESQPELAQRVNAELPGELAAEAARLGIHLIHISTDAVFDGAVGGYMETDAPNPLSVYARTKLAGEQAVLQANPLAAVARVNFFGWSLSGQRSLAEWFYSNLAAGRQVKGFTDVFFCPLLVQHLTGALVEMSEKRLAGLYHAVGPECLSKYDFGRAIARQFGLDENLVLASSVAAGGLTARRSPNLCLSVEKLTAALGRPLPGLESGLRRFHQLHLQGFPQKIQSFAVNRRAE